MHDGLEFCLLFQHALLFHCTLYSDCPSGIRTNTVARHVSFAQITCFF